MTRKLNKEIKAALFDQITAIKQNNMETTFDATDVISISSNEVQIKGTRKTYLNDELTEKVEMSYVWKFKIKNWFLYISDFSTGDLKNQ